MNLAIKSDHFGQLKNKTAVKTYTLTNRQGITIEVLNYGGIIRRLILPDRLGKLENCVLGYDRLIDYEEKSPYFGALIGRYANRIAQGKFTLDGVSYTLDQNHGEHHLHGGKKGFDKVIWEVKEDESEEGPGLILTHISPHMEEGYPGTLTTKVTYRLTEENIFKIEYSYFNFSGNVQQDCLDHYLKIHSSHILMVDTKMIPTGEKMAVANTPFDFTVLQNIRGAITQTHEQLKKGNGFDHCYCIDQTPAQLNKVAELFHPASGRKMEVHTTSPGMQLYTANHLEAPFVPNGAICLETQAYPDSPNQSHFPSTILRPEEPFKSSTHFHFSIA